MSDWAAVFTLVARDGCTWLHCPQCSVDLLVAEPDDLGLSLSGCAALADDHWHFCQGVEPA